MPKLKTHSGAKKRFKLTKSGKVKHMSIYRRHRLTQRSTKRKRALRMPAYADCTNTKTIKMLIPYK